MKLKRKVSSLFKKRNATDVAVIRGAVGGGDVGGANGDDLEPAAHRSILKKPLTRSPGIAIHFNLAQFYKVRQQLANMFSRIVHVGCVYSVGDDAGVLVDA